MPAHTMDLTKSDLINAHFADGSVGLETGGEMMTEEWTLFPGRYRVTLTGNGFGIRIKKNFCLIEDMAFSGS